LFFDTFFWVRVCVYVCVYDDRVAAPVFGQMAVNHVDRYVEDR